METEGPTSMVDENELGAIEADGIRLSKQTMPPRRNGAVTGLGSLLAAVIVVLGILGLSNLQQSDPAAIPSVEPAPSGKALPASQIDATKAAALAESHVVDAKAVRTVRGGFYEELQGIITGKPDLEVPPTATVWVVVIEASFEICPPNGNPCLSPRPGTTTVLLDYVTGDFISSSSFAPAP